MHHEQERDTLAFSHQLYADTPRQLAFQAATVAEAEVWQRELRAKLIELVGGFPPRAVRFRTWSVWKRRISPPISRNGFSFKSRPTLSYLRLMSLLRSLSTVLLRTRRFFCLAGQVAV